MLTFTRSHTLVFLSKSVVKNGITGHKKENPVFAITYDTLSRARMICILNRRRTNKKETEPAASANPF